MQFPTTSSKISKNVGHLPGGFFFQIYYSVIGNMILFSYFLFLDQYVYKKKISRFDISVIITEGALTSLISRIPIKMKCIATRPDVAVQQLYHSFGSPSQNVGIHHVSCRRCNTGTALISDTLRSTGPRNQRRESR